MSFIKYSTRFIACGAMAFSINAIANPLDLSSLATKSQVNSLNSNVTNLDREVSTLSATTNNMRSQISGLAGLMSGNLDIDGDGRIDGTFSMIEVLGIISQNVAKIYEHSGKTWKFFVNDIWLANYELNTVIDSTFATEYTTLSDAHRFSELNLYNSVLKPKLDGYQKLDLSDSAPYTARIALDSTADMSSSVRLLSDMSGPSFTEIYDVLKESMDSAKSDEKPLLKSTYQAVKALSYLSQSFMLKSLSNYSKLPYKFGQKDYPDEEMKKAASKLGQVFYSDMNTAFVYAQLESSPGLSKDQLQSILDDKGGEGSATSVDQFVADVTKYIPDFSKQKITKGDGTEPSAQAGLGFFTGAGKTPLYVDLSKTQLEEKIIDLVTRSSVSEDAGLASLIRKNNLLLSMQLKQTFEMKKQAQEAMLLMTTFINVTNSNNIQLIKKMTEGAKNAQKFADENQ